MQSSQPGASVTTPTTLYGHLQQLGCTLTLLLLRDGATDMLALHLQHHLQKWRAGTQFSLAMLKT
jgi:hypothetical protein